MVRRSRRNSRNKSPRDATAFEPNPDAEKYGGGSFIAIALAIVALALFLRVYQAGTQQLWLDETVSFHIAVIESGLRDVLLNQNTPPLYYLLLRPWVEFAGYSEAAVRGISVLFGTLFVGVAIWLGSMVFNRAIGLWSGLFAAINPIHIYYSQEARAYALLTFLVILSYALLWRALQTNRWRAWAGFTLCAVLALYTHYMAILSLAPTALLVLVWQGPGRKMTLWRHYAVAVLSAAVLFAPWVLMRFSTHGVTGVDWIREAWNYSRVPAILQSLEVLGLGSERGLIGIRLKQYADLVFPWPLRLIGLSILILLGGSFLAPWGDKALGIPWIAKRKAWLASLLLFPLIVLWAVSFFRPFYVVGRYDLTAFPAYPLVLGFGIVKIGNIRRTGRFLAPILALLFFTVVGAKLFAYYHTVDSYAEARSLAEFLDRNVANGDVIVFTGLIGAPTIYYLYRRGYEWKAGTCKSRVRGRSFGCRMFPRATEQNIGVYQNRRVLNSSAQAREDVRSFTEQLEGPNSRLWVVLETVESSPEYDFILPRADARMVAELKTVGFQPQVVHGHIIGFGR